MSGEIFHLGKASQRCVGDVERSLVEALAVLSAIEAGEFLAALPECESDRDQHQIALTLLSLAQRLLSSACHQLASSA